MHNWYKIAQLTGNDLAEIRLLENYAPKLVPTFKEKKLRFNALMKEYFDLLKSPKYWESEITPEIPEETKILDQQLTAILAKPRQKAKKKHDAAMQEWEKQKQQTAHNYDNIHKIKNQLETWARRRFPITNDLKLAGFMLSNGDMLSFTYQGFERDKDHRYVTEAFPENTPIDSGTDGMWQFMKATGAIRINYSSTSSYFAAFDTVSKVSDAQKDKLLNLIQQYHIKQGILNVNHHETQFDSENYYKIINRL